MPPLPEEQIEENARVRNKSRTKSSPGSSFAKRRRRWISGSLQPVATVEFAGTGPLIPNVTCGIEAEAQAERPQMDSLAASAAEAAPALALDRSCPKC